MLSFEADRWFWLCPYPPVDVNGSGVDLTEAVSISADATDAAPLKVEANGESEFCELKEFDDDGGSLWTGALVPGDLLRPLEWLWLRGCWSFFPFNMVTVDFLVLVAEVLRDEADVGADITRLKLVGGVALGVVVAEPGNEWEDIRLRILSCLAFSWWSLSHISVLFVPEDGRDMDDEDDVGPMTSSILLGPDLVPALNGGDDDNDFR